MQAQMNEKQRVRSGVWLLGLLAMSLTSWTQVSRADPPLTTLHSFSALSNGDSGTNADGAYPFSCLVQASDGNLYGTTTRGGTTGNGTVFKITTSGVITTLYSFSGLDGADPEASLIQASDGALYGTTFEGGATGYGTVFKITTSGALTNLHSFDYNDGTEPAALIQASDGALYGTTFEGGATGFGTVFKITTSGALTTLHSFSGTDGIFPQAGPVQASDGALYGTTAGGGATYNGGASGAGTVFKITTSGAFTTLHSFNGSDGDSPEAGLIQATDGALYGTTALSANLDGTVFKITTSGTFTTLYSFSGADGDYPAGGLIQGKDGALYGATGYGGAHDDGTVFKITTSGALTTLYSFDGADGYYPYARLIQGGDGALYGTTAEGGAAYNGGSTGWGTVFQLAIGGTVGTSVHVTNTACAGGGLCLLYARLVQGITGSAYLPGQSLNFLVDGTPVGSATTDAYGKAQLAYLPTTPGTHSITVTFAGNGPYLPSSGAGTLTVNMASTSVSVNNASGTPGRWTALTGSLLDTTNSVGVAGQTVGVTVDGVEVGTATTRRYGAFVFAYLVPANMTVGPHTIAVAFSGSTLYSPSSSAATLTVGP